MVENASAAARQCRQLGGVIFLTLGVKELSRFAGIDNARFIARAIERPEPHALPGCDFVMARGPFDFRSERDFMRQRQISALVAKQSGGEATRAKIDAARDLGISVVMIDRPAIARDPGCDVACDVEAALKWISARGHEIMSARDPGIHGQSGQA
jgi:precorrin-6A/cobalt-precorrin-6A reductase